MQQPLVLIVDDKPENLTVIGELLSPAHAVRVARSGPLALRLARLTPQPDLILLDVMMPGMDGYQVLAALRSDSSTADIAVIFLTALDSAADEERGLEQGAVDYVTKPIRPSILLARVRTQIELKLARDQMRHRNEWLEQEVSRRMRENQLIQDLSIHALARLAETRDTETGKHLLRTQAYVRLLGQALRSLPGHADCITEQALDLLAKSAPLHDIGKVGIPDHILRKPGPLTEAEWAVMQTHAALGAEALAQAEIDAEAAATANAPSQPLAFMVFAKQIARSHHERWDGLGYPDRLAGEAIPLAARLMAVADVYDALVSRRVYKPALPRQQAHDWIVAQRGRHFDPAVIDAFQACHAEMEAISIRHADLDGPTPSTAGSDRSAP